MNNTTFDSYVHDGCGRCAKFQTPQCKVHRWTDILHALRQLLLQAGLNEQMKWGSPCYMVDDKNVIMLASFNEHCGLSFFKGAALRDDHNLLVAPGPNSRYGRFLKFTSVDQVHDRHPHILDLIQQAIQFEREGGKIDQPDEPEPLPAELEQRLASDPDLEQAFYALTPGRQRSHAIFIAGAKQAETRENRVDRCIPKILAGKGYNER